MAAWNWVGLSSWTCIKKLLKVGRRGATQVDRPTGVRNVTGMVTANAKAALVWAFDTINSSSGIKVSKWKICKRQKKLQRKQRRCSYKKNDHKERRVYNKKDRIKVLLSIVDIRLGNELNSCLVISWKFFLSKNSMLWNVYIEKKGWTT